MCNALNVFLPPPNPPFLLHLSIFCCSQRRQYRLSPHMFWACTMEPNSQTPRNLSLYVSLPGAIPKGHWSLKSASPSSHRRGSRELKGSRCGRSSLSNFFCLCCGFRVWPSQVMETLCAFISPFIKCSQYLWFPRVFRATRIESPRKENMLPELCVVGDEALTYHLATRKQRLRGEELWQLDTVNSKLWSCAVQSALSHQTTSSLYRQIFN